MEQSKIATKGKRTKVNVDKTVGLKDSEKVDKLGDIDNYGLNLILDNSLNKYANDPFFIEHAKQVNKKFINKSKP
ncbi:MAG: hypothetical protein JWR09_2162 [Mucilaginibacter sp.]|nr:hypothetical protein [Mucilaginibacter sp.]